MTVIRKIPILEKLKFTCVVVKMYHKNRRPRVSRELECQQPERIVSVVKRWTTLDLDGGAVSLDTRTVCYASAAYNWSHRGYWNLRIFVTSFAFEKLDKYFKLFDKTYLPSLFHRQWNTRTNKMSSTDEQILSILITKSHYINKVDWFCNSDCKKYRTIHKFGRLNEKNERQVGNLLISCFPPAWLACCSSTVIGILIVFVSKTHFTTFNFTGQQKREQVFLKLVAQWYQLEEAMDI